MLFFFDVKWLFIICWPLQEPRHLQFFASFSDSDVYTVLAAKKLHGAPSDYSFCVKVPSPVWTFKKKKKSFWIMNSSWLPGTSFSLVHKVQLGSRLEAALCRWRTDQNLLDHSDAPAEGGSCSWVILSRVWQETRWVSAKRAGQRKLLRDVRATVFFFLSKLCINGEDHSPGVNNNHPLNVFEILHAV